MHEAKCTQATQRDSGARQRAKEAHLAASWALIGYFLDPVLFEMLAASARLQLPNEPFHVPRWRQASLLHFTLNVHHVMRVGHLESPMVWRSLLYPSPARLPLVWRITQLLPMPHDLPTAEVVESAKWLARALLTEHPGAAHPFLPEWIELGEALPGGSQSPGWLRSCAEETSARIAAWLAEHAVGQSQDLHLLTMAVGVLISLLTHKTELIVRGVYGRSALRS